VATKATVHINVIEGAFQHVSKVIQGQPGDPGLTGGSVTFPANVRVGDLLVLVYNFASQTI
jgi:hypothetical protein